MVLVRPEEAEALDPRTFAPFGNIGFLNPTVQTGARIASKSPSIFGFFDDIAKFFSRGSATLPATKTVTQNAFRIGGRIPGAPFRQAASLTSKPTAKLTSATGSTILTSPTKSAGLALPKIPFFSGSLNRNVAAGAITAGSLFGTTAILTQTKSGQELSKEVLTKTSEAGKEFTDFVTENPLIIALLIGLGAIVVLK